METYRLTASALLRLAFLAAQAPGADAGEIVALVQGAEPEAAEPHPTLDPEADGAEGADKPAKPE